MVKLEEHKILTEHKSTELGPVPSKAYIHLSQHIGKIAIPSVKAGDLVLRGQRVADADGFISSNIHSSISGKVLSILDYAHPVLGRSRAVVIESDGEDKSIEEVKREEDEVSRLSADEIRKIIQDCGIVGLGGASFPTYVKLSPKEKVDTFILNGAECEPYLNSDNRLMLEKADEIFKGVLLVLKCIGVKDVYIAIEENKPEAIENFKRLIKGTNYKLKILKSSYPQGGEKQLIKNVLNREVPRGKLPFDVGVVVHNVGTVYAIYEAVYKNKPLYERVVTVAGSILTSPKNLLVKVGTPIKDLIDACGPLTGNVAKIIAGGPMMGIAQYSPLTPVVKATSGIVLFNEKESREFNERVCIRCGECIRECPMGLRPALISQAAEKERWELAKEYGAIDCIECGICSYVCPANRFIVQAAKLTKLKIRPV